MRAYPPGSGFVKKSGGQMTLPRLPKREEPDLFPSFPKEGLGEVGVFSKLLPPREAGEGLIEIIASV